MSNEKIIWDYLRTKGFSACGTAAIMGNLYHESLLDPKNLEDTGNRKLGMTDVQYVNAVDNGTYTNFLYDACGFGLAQWTYWSRKQGLLKKARAKNASIADISVQLDFLIEELQESYSNLYNYLKTSNSISDATSKFMLQFERPYDQSANAQAVRARTSQKYYDNYASSTISTSIPVTQIQKNDGILRKGSTGEKVKELQTNLIKLGFSCGTWGADGDFGNDTLSALIAFQSAYGIDADGEAGPITFATIEKALKNLTSQSTPVVQQNISQRKTYSDVMIGYAAKDENGRYSGGAAGDQTRVEVRINNWYNFGQNVILRPNDTIVAEKIARACEDACNNDNVGYDQNQRNTLYIEAQKVGMDLSKITNPCECDCSSLASICCICAGLPASYFYVYNNMCTTYTMRAACRKTGKFSELSDSQYLLQKSYLKRGDIILNENSHVAICLQDGANAPQNTTVATTNNIINGKVTAGLLNVRKGAGTNYPVVSTLWRGSIIEITELSNNWGKCYAGWVCLDYVERI